MKRSMQTKDGLASELAALTSLDRHHLLKRWRSLYGVDAPAKISQQLLVRAIAYKLQEKVLGNLKPATRKYLASASQGSACSLRPSPAIKPGARLIREWHGCIHEVVITDTGVQYSGKVYGSLSEVARIITGVKWSGPAFFGLKSRHSKGTRGSIATSPQGNEQEVRMGAACSP